MRSTLLALACAVTLAAGGCRLYSQDEYGYCKCRHPHLHKPDHHQTSHEHPEFDAH